nr:MAG TPA: hypothetical protein [Caudoviricetes sp.]
MFLSSFFTISIVIFCIFKVDSVSVLSLYQKTFFHKNIAKAGE